MAVFDKLVKRLILIAFVSVCGTLTGSRVSAQYASVHARLVSSTPGNLAYLGSSVALGGELLAVGAPGDTSTGKVYLWRHVAPNWTFEDVLQGNDQISFAESGEAVAVSGDTVAVGARFQHVSGVSTGAVYLFVRTGGVWTQQQKIWASDAALGDYFGDSLVLEGDTLLVGATFGDGTATDSGAVYVFTRSGSVWTEQTKLTASDGAMGDLFGFSVALSGSTAVIGARDHSTTAIRNGAAYVFVGSGSSWSFQQKLTASDASDFDSFGGAVDVQGDRAVVGASEAGPSGSEHPGAAYVFERSASTWTETARLQPAFHGQFDRFGCNLDLQDDIVAIGATDENAVYLYQLVAGSWVKIQRLESTIGNVDYGWDVAFDGSKLAVGAREEGGGAGISWAGAARTYRVNDSFGAFCFGDGSGTNCPCSNTSNPGSEKGCRHSGGKSAKLLVGGVASVSADTVVLYGHDMRATLAMYIQGSTYVNLGLGAVYHDGLRCAGPPIVRLGSGINPANGSSTYPSLANPIPISVRGGVSPGQVKTYQIVFRDNAPGFCTTGNLNTTNGVEVVWGP